MLFKPMISAIEPISKDIVDILRRIQGQSYLDDWLYRSGKMILEE
jgi:hypothetical protein